MSEDRNVSHGNSLPQSTDDLATVRSLINKLSDEKLKVRQEARRSLVAIGEPAVPLLIKTLSSRKTRVRWEAAKALEEIRSPLAVPALVKTLEDKEFDVRWLAAEALIRIGPECLGPLLRALIKHSKSVWLRESAHHILNHMAGGDYMVEHHLVDHPAPRSPNVREIIRPVVAALRDTEPLMQVPVAARKALEALEAQHIGPTAT